MKRHLWFDSWTEEYMEGLPVGNGRIAAMMLGRPERLRVALNHEWLWRGENRFREYPDVSEHLAEVREALRAAGREDLIGTGRNCLVPPEGVKSASEYAQIRRERKERIERREQREMKNARPGKGKPDTKKARPQAGKKPSSRPANKTK